MIIFLQASRSLAEPHSSVSVHFVTALMSSSQRARGRGHNNDIICVCVPTLMLSGQNSLAMEIAKVFELRDI